MTRKTLLMIAALYPLGLVALVWVVSRTDPYLLIRPIYIQVVLGILPALLLGLITVKAVGARKSHWGWSLGVGLWIMVVTAAHGALIQAAIASV